MKLICTILLLTFAAFAKDKEVPPTPQPSEPMDYAARAEYAKRIAFLMGAQNMFLSSLTSEQKRMQENITNRDKAAADALEPVAKSCPTGTELDRTKAVQLEFICTPKPK